MLPKVLVGGPQPSSGMAAFSVPELSAPSRAEAMVTGTPAQEAIVLKNVVSGTNSLSQAAGATWVAERIWGARST